MFWILKTFWFEKGKKKCQQRKYINLNADTYMWNVVHNMWDTSINWITTWIKSGRDRVEEWFTLNSRHMETESFARGRSSYKV